MKHQPRKLRLLWPLKLQRWESPKPHLNLPSRLPSLLAKSVAMSVGAKNSNRVSSQPRVQKSTLSKSIELVIEKEDTKPKDASEQGTQGCSANETEKSMANVKGATS